ncbi:MAG: hypothetical protein SCALA702_16660 [Melioribacteraceae bacterium]|nr:MAG: hypothetical protein SCALA702_16660 [Melioribacteraceae bacterium]
MWKGWISLLVAGWFLVTAAVATLQDATSLTVVGILMIIVGIVKISTWHDLLSMALGAWLLFSSALGWVSGTVFIASAVVIGYLGIIYVRLNTPELGNNNA